MTKLLWNQTGEKLFHVGVDRGVLYPITGSGVPWNGLISVNESPTGGDPTPYYVDGVKYQNRPSPEEFQATIDAYTYPDEFAECDGTALINAGLSAEQQPRKSFGLCYRTKTGNDVDGLEHGYQLHFVYNALASPSSKNNQSISDSPEPLAFSWGLTTTPVIVPGYKASAHMIVDSTKTNPLAMIALENLIYGTDDTSASLPSPAALISLFETEWNDLFVVDNGDGTFTVTSYDDQVTMLDLTTFQINSVGVSIVDADSYTVSST